jgi:hypothetical protein
MPPSNWRDEVAKLLGEVGGALVARRDREAAKLLGTTLAYVEKAQARGEQGAAELFRHFREVAENAGTERFRFEPGELEAIKSRRGGP